jgi:hypothetical protein
LLECLSGVRRADLAATKARPRFAGGVLYDGLRKSDGGERGTTVIPTQALMKVLVAATAGLATSPSHGAEPSPIADVITCTNPAGGVSWQVRIDYVKRTVDSNPARISDTQISWHDAAEGRNYTLDRTSGALTVVGASSTGGYFLFDRCTVKNAH